MTKIDKFVFPFLLGQLTPSLRFYVFLMWHWTILLIRWLVLWILQS